MRFCALFFSESTWVSSSLPSHTGGWNPHWFSKPDLTCVLLLYTGVLGWEDQHGVEAFCSSRGNSAAEMSLQILNMWAQGHLFCISTLPTSFEVASSVYHYL